MHTMRFAIAIDVSDTPASKVGPHQLEFLAEITGVEAYTDDLNDEDVLLFESLDAINATKKLQTNEFITPVFKIDGQWVTLFEI